MKNVLVGLWCCAFLLGMNHGRTEAAESTDWTEDFDAALATAQKDGHDLLMDFTGSDWCPWCVKLHKEVFEQEAFKTEAPKHFTLVELDFPRNKEQSEKIKTQNAKLAQRFAIQGFPSVYLADAKGRVYARTGYEEGGPEKYLKHLTELQAQKTTRDELFEKAAKASGMEKAKLLDQALSALDANGAMVGYDEQIQQIVELDATNAGGLKNKYEMRRRLSEAEATLKSQDIPGAVAKLDALIKDFSPTGDIKQDVYFLKASASAMDKKPKDEILSLLQEAYKANPESEKGKQIAQILEKLKQAP